MRAENIEDKQVLKESAELLPVLTKEIQERLENTVMTTNDKLRDLIKTGYYNRVSITFRCLIYEAILFFEATHEELDILSAVGSRNDFLLYRSVWPNCSDSEQFKYVITVFMENTFLSGLITLQSVF